MRISGKTKWKPSENYALLSRQLEGVAGEGGGDGTSLAKGEFPADRFFFSRCCCFCRHVLEVRRAPGGRGCVIFSVERLAPERITTTKGATTRITEWGTSTLWHKGLHLAGYAGCVDATSCKRGQCLVNGPESIACDSSKPSEVYELWVFCVSCIYNADSDSALTTTTRTTTKGRILLGN